jgi:hypothetical protein
MLHSTFEMFSTAHLPKMYQQHPGDFTPLLPQLLKLLPNPSTNPGEKIVIILIFSEVAKSSPKVGGVHTLR